MNQKTVFSQSTRLWRLFHAPLVLFQEILKPRNKSFARETLKLALKALLPLNCIYNPFAIFQIQLARRMREMRMRVRRDQLVVRKVLSVCLPR